MNLPIHSPLLSTQEAADYLQLSRSTLEKMRCKGVGPKYLKMGGRVRYRIADLDEYLNGCVIDPPE